MDVVNNPVNIVSMVQQLLTCVISQNVGIINLLVYKHGKQHRLNGFD